MVKEREAGCKERSAGEVNERERAGERGVKLKRRGRGRGNRKGHVFFLPHVQILPRSSFPLFAINKRDEL